MYINNIYIIYYGLQDGLADMALVNSPAGVRFAPVVEAADTNMQRLAIADEGNSRIRVLTLPSPRALLVAGNMSTVAGSSNEGLVEGLASEATFNKPQGLCFTSDALRLLIADQGNNR